MLDFLKGILGKKEPEPLNLAFDAIPSWLASHDANVRDNLVNATKEPIRNIRNAAAKLQLVVNNISEAEQDPALHPKIKSVAKNSLPLFVKAMNATLAKELPEDPELFYPAAVECVKACLNSLRGQGRYLMIVFPDEMKATKAGIDTMGREINTLTAALSTYRNSKALSDAIRTIHTSISGMNEGLNQSEEKDARIDRRIGEFTARMDAIDKELAELCTNDAREGVTQQQNALVELEQSRDEAIRHYAALSMTASHVFRKAEKIAQKQHNKADTDLLRTAMELLSDHAIPSPADLEGALKNACPVAERMIGAGEIALKNKEERAVFSDTARFCSEICAAGSLVKEREVAFIAAEEKLAADPCIVRMNSLEREKTQQQVMLDKEIHNRRDLEEWRAKTREQIPVLVEDLTKKIVLIAGEGTRVRISGI